MWTEPAGGGCGRARGVLSDDVSARRAVNRPPRHANCAHRTALSLQLFTTAGLSLDTITRRRMTFTIDTHG